MFYSQRKASASSKLNIPYFERVVIYNLEPVERGNFVKYGYSSMKVQPKKLTELMNALAGSSMQNTNRRLNSCFLELAAYAC